MGLNGSKSMLTFFSFPSSVTIVPQYTTKPFGGTFVYNFKRCCTDVIAPEKWFHEKNNYKVKSWQPWWLLPKTDNLLTLDLMLEAVPYSSANILLTRLIWSPGGIMREIMEVPLPRAACNDLMSFLIFQISTFLSEFVSSDILLPFLKNLFFVKEQKESK